MPEKTGFAFTLFFLLALLLLGSVFLANTSEGLLAWSVGVIYVCYDTWLLSYVAWQTLHLAAPKPTTEVKSSVSISVLIPARNEAASIVTTVNEVLRQQEPPEQIIVIDDGSTDATWAVLKDAFGLTRESAHLARSSQHPSLLVLTKPNSGKADSMNQALPLCEGDVIVTVDADTQLEKTAIAAIRRAFSTQDKLVAACGILTPRRATGWTARVFTWFQHFEYLRAFLARAAWMQSNALLLVSGAFAAYRRAPLLAVGGYDRDSLVEDYELIHRMHRHAHDRGLDWQVRVIEDALATTEVPTDLWAFWCQRRRWFAGFLRTQLSYRSMVGNPRYGSVGRLMLPIKTADTLQPLFGLTAIYFLIGFLFSESNLALYALAVIGIKLAIDFCYHLWALRLYHRWLGEPLPAAMWWRATLCTVAEPFFFQIARHIGALMGWLYLFSTQVSWTPSRSLTQR